VHLHARVSQACLRCVIGWQRKDSRTWEMAVWAQSWVFHSIRGAASDADK
jgi:hypothetical protein